MTEALFKYSCSTQSGLHLIRKFRYRPIKQQHLKLPATAKCATFFTACPELQSRQAVQAHMLPPLLQSPKNKLCDHLKPCVSERVILSLNTTFKFKCCFYIAELKAKIAWFFLFAFVSRHKFDLRSAGLSLERFFPSKNTKQWEQEENEGLPEVSSPRQPGELGRF